MSKRILRSNRDSVRSTYAIGILSLFIIASAVASYLFQSGITVFFVAAISFGGLLFFITASRLISLSSEEWHLSFDESKDAFDWNFKAKHEVVPIANLEKVEFSFKMRADGMIDSIVTLHVRGCLSIELPNEFSDIIMIDKIKSLCKERRLIFVDGRDRERQ